MPRYYYYDQLNAPEQRRAYMELLEAVRSGQDVFTPSRFMDTDHFKKVISGLEYDHPELFFAELNRYSFTAFPGRVTYHLFYKCKNREREEKEVRFFREVSRIMGLLKNAHPEDDADIFMWLHNYLIKNTSYCYAAAQGDYEHHRHAFDAYGALVEHTAVCIGISKAFKVLCDCAGKDCMIVTGTSFFDGMPGSHGHAWNIVGMEKEGFAHIDVTWDMNLSENLTHARADYFCIPDSRMRADHEYSNFPECSCKKNSYFSRMGRDFSNSRELQVFLDAAFHNKPDVDALYFRVERNASLFDTLSEQIDMQVNKTVLKNGHNCISMPNKRQMCFYYRII